MRVINGYIKLFRKFTEWEWYSDGIVKAVFLHLLLSATYKPARYQGYELNPGDVVIGREKLAAALGLSVQQIRTALKKLEDTGEITLKSTNRFSVATLVNWGVYQDDEEPEQPTNNHQSTINQPTNNHQSTINQPHLKNIRNNNNNKRNIKNIINNLLSGGGGGYTHTRACAHKELDVYKDMTDEIKTEIITFAQLLFDKYMGRPPAPQDITKVYEAIRCRTANGWVVDNDKQEILDYAFGQASQYNKLNWAYIHGVLEHVRERGFTTRGECEFYDIEREEGRN